MKPLNGRGEETNPDAPVLVDHTLLELGKEEIDSLGRVVADDHLTGSHGGVSN
jgi:hypothetical protein